MDYNKPRKGQANLDFLRKNGVAKSSTPYQEMTIAQKKTFLIICEGQNTEPLYFEGFPVPTNCVKVLGGYASKTKLVRYALDRMKDERYNGWEMWCVFDFDKKPDEVATQAKDFNNAILLAEANGMKVAWSNDSFELWFFLHFENLDSNITRNEMKNVLRKNWGLVSYHNKAKKREFCEGHYQRHIANQKIAIKRALALHKKYLGRKDFASHCPCTTVYQLVNELIRNLKK